MNIPPPADDSDLPSDEQGDQQQQPEPPAAGAPAKRGPGRPTKWDATRRIEQIYEGRMSFQPGDSHPMDKQLDEAHRLRQEIIEQLAQVQQLVTELAELDDASVTISREEQAVKALLWDLYSSRKHRDHLLATFIAARRRRMLHRLRAASAALEQARAFLRADEAILPRLQRTIADAQRAALALHGPPPPYPVAQEAEEQQDQIDDGEREAVEDQEAPGGSEQPEEAADEHQEARRSLLEVSGGGDDAGETRAQLAAFDERVRAMRSAITNGRGWFEWFFIPKRKKGRQVTPEALEYLQRGEQVPEDIIQYYVDEGEKKQKEDDERPYGPYLRYRWYEGGGRRRPIQYSLGMGLIKARDRRRDDAEPPLL
jgi:hypothetical protein